MNKFTTSNIGFHSFSGHLHVVGKEFMINRDKFLKAYDWVFENHKETMGAAKPLPTGFHTVLKCQPEIREGRPYAAEGFLYCFLAIALPQYQVYLTQSTYDKGADIIVKNGDEYVMVVDSKTGKGRIDWKVSSENRKFLINLNKGLIRYVVSFNSYLERMPSKKVLNEKNSFKTIGCTTQHFICMILSSLEEDQRKVVVNELLEFTKFLKDEE